MASSRLVQLATHPQGEVVSFPCYGDKLCLTSVQSHFPKATGLKYCLRNTWVAVPLESGVFLIPETADLFIVVSAAIDDARQLLSRRSLATQVAAAFKNSNAVAPQPALSRPFSAQSFPPPRKQKRNMAAKCTNVNKMYKVVFIRQTHLPVNFSKGLVLLEGMVSINSGDEEEVIKEKLRSVLQTANIIVNNSDVTILSYVTKQLSVPCVVPGFSWKGEDVKTNVGQGKLYVMVSKDEVTVN